LRLVVGSKCCYEINKCADASCGNEILIDIIHLTYQFAHVSYMFMFYWLDLVLTLLFFYHKALPLTQALSLSLRYPALFPLLFVEYENPWQTFRAYHCLK